MRKSQNELRDVAKHPLVSKEAQDSLKNDLQQQLQEVEQRRHDLMSEHQKVQKMSQKIQSIQDQRRNMQKESPAAQAEMRKIREEIDRNEVRFRQLSDKVNKNKMADAEMAAELEELQAGGEIRGSDASQTGDCCVEELWQRFNALGANQMETMWQRVPSVRREVGAFQEQRPGREGGRRNREDKQEQGKASQQLVLPASGGVMKALQRVAWSLIFFVFGVHMVNAEEQGIQVQQRSKKDLGQIHR